MSIWANRTEDNYWSPAQVRLFVGGVWIDDACGVLYRVVDNKSPKFGYNDRTFRSVARGTTIVQGRLSVQFRFNGYLRSVIQDNVRERQEQDIMLSGFRVGLYPKKVPDGVMKDTATVLEWISSAAASVDSEQRQTAFEFLKQQFWGEKPSSKPSMTDQEGIRPSDSSDMRDLRADLQVLNRPGLLTPGFDIVMVYGEDPANVNSPEWVKVIQDVHLTDESQVIEIDAPDGSRPVREVYSFVAKDVAPGEIGREVGVSGGAVAN